MKTPRPLFALAAAALLALSLPCAAGPDDGWVKDADEKGVLVTTRTDPGRSLPVFRGVGTVDASVLEILAVLDDASRFTEWMSDCTSAYVVK